MSARAVRLAAVGIVAGAALSVVIAAPALADDAAGDDPSTSFVAQNYPGDPAAESLIVAMEDERLVDARAVVNAAGWTNANLGRPYRMQTGDSYTLVLIRRDAPYTFENLLELAPRTLMKQADGSYLLSENIIVERGATLRIADSHGLTLRMESSADRFVSIVTLGGTLELAGSESSPVTISSWDPVEGDVDRVTADGRSYLRVIGGHVEFSHVEFHDLGFWSGTTGGVALTGTEDPGVAEPPDAAGEDGSAAQPEAHGSKLYIVGSGQTVALNPDLTKYAAVSAIIDDVYSHDNAYGLFVTSADSVDIRESDFERNLVDGLVLHRFVTNTTVSGSTARENGGDGFMLGRATTHTVLDGVRSERNGRNGITLEGGPLADGPSATGVPTGSYGQNAVRNGTFLDNGRYGIEVNGGTEITIDNNRVRGHQMGLVVTHDVEGVEVTDNQITDSVQHAIALTDGVTFAVVTGNSVRGAETGIYLRGAGGEVADNEISGMTNHAVTVVAESQSTVVLRNTVAGRGPSAIDVARSAGAVTVSDNVTDDWESTKPLDVVLRSALQPLTVLWIVLGLLVVITAVSGLGRKLREIRHPYSSHAPLSSLTAGVVAPEAIGLRAPAWMRPMRMEDQPVAERDAA